MMHKDKYEVTPEPRLVSDHFHSMLQIIYHINSTMHQASARMSKNGRGITSLLEYYIRVNIRFLMYFL